MGTRFGVCTWPVRFSTLSLGVKKKGGILVNRGNHVAAFREYDQVLRPFITEIQATAAQNVQKTFLPQTQ